VLVNRDQNAPNWFQACVWIVLVASSRWPGVGSQRDLAPIGLL
jgi:hypothetical protein